MIRRLKPWSLLAKARLGGGEELVDDVVVAADAVIDERIATIGADDEERLRLALIDPLREFDIDLGAVIESAQRPPRWIIARDRVAERQVPERDTGIARHCSVGCGVLLFQREELILRIGPGDRGPYFLIHPMVA
jgi:hypothetical protein